MVSSTYFYLIIVLLHVHIISDYLSFPNKYLEKMTPPPTKVKIKIIQAV